MTTPATILIVDDNDMNRDALSRRLERASHRTLLAEDGYKALGIIGDQHVDLILLDIMMPGITGLDVLKIVRQNHTSAELPVIMTTAKTQNDDMIEAFALGANDYVTKPINFPILLARIQSQLSIKFAPAMAETMQIDRQLSISEIKPGVILSERYQLETQIGEGGFGTVYQARHLGLQRPVAVKILRASLTNAPDALARFQREGITTCRVQHPNAISIYDFDVTPGGVAFLVMERLTGQSLKEALAQQGPLSPGRCAEILRPLCAALAVAHADGVVHRDLKPANIFLHMSRQGEVVKVLDFGIAKLVGQPAENDLTGQDSVLGTPSYMPPEQIMHEEINGRSDVYSLGALLFEMLTGHRLFGVEGGMPAVTILKHLQADPPPPSHFNPSISPAVDQVVLQALQKKKEQRPSAAELAALFTAAVG